MNRTKSVLDEIVENKRQEIDKKKRENPLNASKISLNKSSRSFLEAISVEGVGLIAEIKKSSPNMKIEKEIEVGSLASIYENSGVSAISVLCDEKYFSGSFEDLKEVSGVTKVMPILCKEFIIDEYQIYKARECGADAVLLIARILSLAQIKSFIEIAKKLGMDAVCEVNNEGELKSVLELNPEIIMINNRNLETFEINLETTNKLVKLISKDKVVISASGINSCRDVSQLSERVNAVLVGTSIMKSNNPKEKIKQLLCKK